MWVDQLLDFSKLAGCVLPCPWQTKQRERWKCSQQLFVNGWFLLEASFQSSPILDKLTSLSTPTKKHDVKWHKDIDMCAMEWHLNATVWSIRFHYMDYVLVHACWKWSQTKQTKIPWIRNTRFEGKCESSKHLESKKLMYSTAQWSLKQELLPHGTQLVKNNKTQNDFWRGENFRNLFSVLHAWRTPQVYFPFFSRPLPVASHWDPINTVLSFRRDWIYANQMNMFRVSKCCERWNTELGRNACSRIIPVVMLAGQTKLSRFRKALSWQFY